MLAATHVPTMTLRLADLDVTITAWSKPVRRGVGKALILTVESGPACRPTHATIHEYEGDTDLPAIDLRPGDTITVAFGDEAKRVAGIAPD